MADLAGLTREQLLQRRELLLQKDRLLTREKFLIESKRKEERVGAIGTVSRGEFEEGERNIAGDIFERPGAAVRGAIQSGFERLRGKEDEGVGRGFLRGAIRPQEIPRFQDIAIEKGQEAGMKGRISAAVKRKGLFAPDRFLGKQLFTSESFARGLLPSAAGLAADVVTNPADVLLSILTFGLSKTGVGGTRGAQALKRFGTKERGIAGRGIFRKGIRGVRKFKTERIKGVKAPIEQRVKAKIAEVKAEKGAAVSKIKEQTQTKIARTSQQIDDEVLNLTDDLQRSSETSSLEFQKRIPKRQRAASNEYGKRLDDIADDLARRNEGITKGEIREALVDTLGEVNELALPEGRAANLMEKFLNEKYTAGNRDVIIPLREVLKDTKLIKGQASSGVKLGTKSFSDDELAIAIFNNKFGEVLGTKAPELKVLNRSYAPVMRLNKAAHKTFKPRAGELQTKAGTQIIKRVAEGKAERGERELIRILQEGTEFGEGIGAVTTKPVSLAKRISGLKTGKEKAVTAISRAGKIKAQRETAIFDRKLSSLAKRDTRVAQLLRNKAKMNKIRGAIATGTITGGIAFTLIQKFFGIIKGAVKE